MKHLKNQTNSRATNSGFVEFEVQRNDHIVQKKAASIKSIEMKLRPSLKEPLNTLSTTYFQEAYNLNCLKPKISIEVQTDESSFDQRIVENQWNSFGYNVENYSTSPRSFTPFMDNDHVTDQKSPNTASSGFASASDNTDFSPYQTASPDTEISSVVPTYVTFLFKNDETCAVEVYRNGKKEKLKNFFGKKHL
uniref:Uncharacterized protein n=1 Tax=Panagrolaimus sp. ES5 TaxID=591445 RepID=A0AC34F870_9BILA